MHTEEEKQLRLEIVRLQEKVIQAKLCLNGYNQNLLMKSVSVRGIVEQLHAHYQRFFDILQNTKGILCNDYWQLFVSSRDQKKLQQISQELQKSSLSKMAVSFKRFCEEQEFQNLQSSTVQIALSQLYLQIESAKRITGGLTLSPVNEGLILQVNSLRSELVSGFELLRTLHIQSKIALGEYARRQLPNNITLQADDEKRLRKVEQSINESDSFSFSGVASRFFS